MSVNSGGHPGFIAKGDFPITATKPRTDLPIEVATTLDASGNYAGDWVDSNGIYAVRVLYWFNNSPAPTVFIEESSDGATALDPGGYVASQKTAVTIQGRYFRLVVSGGASGATFRASVRSDS